MLLLTLALLAAAPDKAEAAARALEQKAHELQAAGRYAEAEKPLLEAIELWKKNGVGNVDQLNDEMNLAVSWRRRGEAPRAAAALERVVAAFAKSKDPDAPELHRKALNNLAAAYRDSSRLADARTALLTCLKLLGPGGPSEERARVLDNLATVAMDLGDDEGAEGYARRGLAEWKALRGPDDVDLGISMAVTGTLLLGRGELDEARPFLEGALRIAEKAYGPDHPRVAASLNLVGALELRSGHLDAAQQALQRSVKILSKQFDEGHPLLRDARKSLARLEQARRK